MLTHNVLGAEQGYPAITRIFERNEAFAKKEDPVIEFFADTLEPMSRAYAFRRYGDMFKILGSAPAIRAHADKLSWRSSMDDLNELRTNGTIGEVLDHLKHSRRPQPSDRVMKREDKLSRLGDEPIPADENVARSTQSIT